MHNKQMLRTRKRAADLRRYAGQSEMKDNEMKDAMLKDLDLQWKDHFHMRDQTWKTLNNSVLVFLGIVG